MEVASEGNNGFVAGKKGDDAMAGEGQIKPKRQMKTPFQIEILEKTYAHEAYPPEGIRAELSKQLGLTDRQLQMWFCHRRLKTKRDEAAQKRREMDLSDSPPKYESIRVAEQGEHVSGSGSGYDSGSSPFEPWKGVPKRVGVRPVMDGLPLRRMPIKRSYGELLPPPLSGLERRAITLVEDQLGEPLREDGPILGMEFDPLPPDAFGAEIGTSSVLCYSS